MKTAVLISGQMRTFKKCYATQRWQIFKHYEPDIHFFVACCDDFQAVDAELLRGDYKNVSVLRIPDPDTLTEVPLEQGRHAPYANAATHYKLMLQHWGNKQAWEFFGRKTDPASFDTIIRIRPDLWIHRFRPPRFYQVEGTIDTRTAFCPWWGKFGGINDRLAVMGVTAAETYFNTIDAIPDLLKQGCPFHPETLVYENLMQDGINIQNTLMTEFSTDRLDGSRRWWNQEVMLSDLADLTASK